jgi:hypothetical protein
MPQHTRSRFFKSLTTVSGKNTHTYYGTDAAIEFEVAMEIRKSYLRRYLKQQYRIIPVLQTPQHRMSPAHHDAGKIGILLRTSLRRLKKRNYYITTSQISVQL